MFDKALYRKNREAGLRGQGPKVPRVTYYSWRLSRTFLDEKVVTDAHGQFISAKRHPLEYWARRIELQKEMEARRKPKRTSLKDALKAGDDKA